MSVRSEAITGLAALLGECSTAHSHVSQGQNSLFSYCIFLSKLSFYLVIQISQKISLTFAGAVSISCVNHTEHCWCKTYMRPNSHVWHTYSHDIYLLHCWKWHSVIIHTAPIRIAYSRVQSLTKCSGASENVFRKMCEQRDRLDYYVPVRETLKCLSEADLWHNCVLGENSAESDFKCNDFTFFGQNPLCFKLAGSAKTRHKVWAVNY